MIASTYRCPTRRSANLQFYKPADNSAEMAYVRSRRKALGGFMPSRRRRADPTAVPPIDSYARFALQADGKEMSTTMAAVRMLGALLRDKHTRSADRSDRGG